MLDYLSRQRAVMKNETYPQRYVDALNAEIAELRGNHCDWMDDDEQIRKFLFATLGLLGVNGFDSECRTPDAAQFLHDLVRAKLAGRAAAAEGVPEKACEQSGANSDNIVLSNPPSSK